MKVAILCGGKGTRLQEQTQYCPKPLVEVGGFPLLWHVMKIYAHQGFNEFVLLLGYRSEMIKEFFFTFPRRSTDFTLHFNNRGSQIVYHTNHNLANWMVTFVDTGAETQTGARIARAKAYLDKSDFFLTYGDGVADIDLQSLYETHQKQGRILTVTGVKQRSPYGIMKEEAGLVLDFKEKPLLEGRVNGGFLVANPRIFTYLSEAEECVLEEEPMRCLVRDGQLAIYEHNGFWQAVDTPKQLIQLNQLWATNPPWRIW